MAVEPIRGIAFVSIYTDNFREHSGRLARGRSRPRRRLLDAGSQSRDHDALGQSGDRAL